MTKPFTHCQNVLDLIGDFCGCNGRMHLDEKNPSNTVYCLRFGINRTGNLERYIKILRKIFFRENTVLEIVGTLRHSHWHPVKLARVVGMERFSRLYEQTQNPGVFQSLCDTNLEEHWYLKESFELKPYLQEFRNLVVRMERHYQENCVLNFIFKFDDVLENRNFIQDPR